MVCGGGGQVRGQPSGLNSFLQMWIPGIQFMPSASAASLPMEASCLPEMFFTNSPVPAVATTLPAEFSVSVSILGNLCQIVVFSKKEPGALLFIDLHITRSLTVTMPSLAEAGVPNPHALHLWLGAHPICLSMPMSPFRVARHFPSPPHILLPHFSLGEARRNLWQWSDFETFLSVILG